VNGRIQQDAQATAANPDIAAAPATLRSGARELLVLLLQPQPGLSEDGGVQTVQAGVSSITLM
jgi:hypothetical protein